MRQYIIYPLIYLIVILTSLRGDYDSVEGSILQQCRTQKGLIQQDFEGIYKHGDIMLTGLFPIHAELIAFNSSNEEQQKVDFFNFQGFNWVLAMIYTIEWINNQTDLLHNITFGYDIRDTYYNIEHAVGQAINLTNAVIVESICNQHGNNCRVKSSVKSQSGQSKRSSSPLVSIGPSYAWIASPVADIFSAYGIPLISYESTSPSRQYRDRLFLQIRQSNLLQAYVIADLVQEFNWSYITVISTDDEYGQLGLQNLQQQLNIRDGTCIGRNFVIPGGDQIDLILIKNVIASIKQDIYNRVCVVYTNVFQAGAIFDEAAKQQLNQMTWIATDAWGHSPGIIYQNKNVLQGMITIGLPDREPLFDFQQFLQSVNGPFDNDSSPLPKSLLDKYFHHIQQCRAHHFNTGQSCDLECFYNRFFCYGIDNVEGFNYVIDAVLAVGSAVVAMKHCRPGIDGLLKGKKCPSPPPNIIRSELWTYLNAVSFQDFYGFNFSFHHPPDTHFMINNLQLNNHGEPQLVHIGQWSQNGDKNVLSINHSRIVWNSVEGTPPTSRCNKACLPGYQIYQKRSKCCWNCIACSVDHYSENEDSVTCSVCSRGYVTNFNRTRCNRLPITYISLTDGNGIAVIFTIFSLLGGLVALAFTSLFVRYRHNGTIKAGSSELSTLLLIFIMISFCLPILFCLKPTNLLCRLRSFLTFNTLVPSLAILLAKTHRVVRLFNARLSTLMGKKYFSNTYILLLVVAICAPPLILSIILIALYPARATYSYEDHLVLLVCQTSNSNVAVILQSILYGYFGVLALYCIYLAYRQRRLPQQFNEARQIAFPMCTICLTSIATIITDFSTSGIAEVVVYSIVIFVNCTVILVFLFVPKIRTLRQHVNKDNHGANRFSYRLRDIVSLGFTIGILSKSESMPNQTDVVSDTISPEGETYVTEAGREIEATSSS